MRFVGKIFLIIFCVAAYLNIGWIVGSYYERHVAGKTPAQLSRFAKVVAGPGAFMTSPPAPIGTTTSKVFVISLAWPVVVAGVAIAWIPYGIYYAVYYGTGGLAKALGF